MLDAHVSEKSADTLIATVQDHALLIYLPQNDIQSLWRFDLDSLTEHGFRIIGRDGFYDLTICNLDNTDRIVGRFLQKQDAQQTLELIYSALRRPNADALSGSPFATCPAPIALAAQKTELPPRPRRGWRVLFGWLTFWRVVFLIAIAALLFSLLSPRGLSHSNRKTATLTAPPAGVPIDADQALPE